MFFRKDKSALDFYTKKYFLIHKKTFYMKVSFSPGENLDWETL